MSSIRPISMFGSTMEMMDVRAMKTCIAPSWISWIPAWPVNEYTIIILSICFSYIFSIFII